MIDISLLLPTRNRLEPLYQLFDSIVKTTAHPEALEIVLYIDEDDIPSHAISYPSLKINKLIRPRNTMGRVNNSCYEASCGRYVMLMNDDVIFRTKNWDIKVMEAAARFRDDISLIYGNDMYQKRSLAAFPVLPRKACEIMARVCPSEYKGGFIDAHIFDIFKKLAGLGHKRTIYLGDVIFEHINLRVVEPVLKDSCVIRDPDADELLYIAWSEERRWIAARMAQYIESHQKNKILHLTTDSRIGGAEKNIITLVTHLDRDRYENMVVALMPGGELIEKLRGYGIRAECLEMKSKFDLRAFFNLYRLIKNNKIDILHTYLFHANILGRIVGRLAGVPVIISSIRVMERRRYHLWIDWLTNWMVDRETCVCEAVRNFTIEKGHIRPEKLVTIPNVIDTTQYGDCPKIYGAERVGAPATAGRGLSPEIKELGIDSNYPVLGIVARLHQQKGHIYLLKAMPEIIKEYPQTLLLVIGDGPLRKKLENLCFKLKITKHVQFLGLRHDAREIMALVDIFILSSLWEGMSNVMLEAMALRRPIVATRVGGAEELIEDKQSGILVPSADERALASAVIHILASPDKGKELGKMARKQVERRFSVETMLKKTEALYFTLINR